MSFDHVTRRLFLSISLLSLAGCATSDERSNGSGGGGATDVQEVQDGSYRISARAVPMSGIIGAQDVAYKDAQKFCMSKMQRALVVDNVFAGGNVNLHFRCTLQQ
jgi:hypothetical protein